MTLSPEAVRYKVAAMRIVRAKELARHERKLIECDRTLKEIQAACPHARPEHQAGGQVEPGKTVCLDCGADVTT